MDTPEDLSEIRAVISLFAWLFGLRVDTETFLSFLNSVK